VRAVLRPRTARSALLMVKPATVIAWHQRLSRGYWRWRSRQRGRPPIPGEHVALIRRISGQHPEWAEDRIAEELAIKLGVRHSTSTIRFVLSIRTECLGRMIPLGEGHLRLIINEYLEHYHGERTHQGLGNRLIEEPPPGQNGTGPVRCRERLGGVLKFYYREAA
jgi:hypothetical protein